MYELIVNILARIVDFLLILTSHLLVNYIAGSIISQGPSHCLLSFNINIIADKTKIMKKYLVLSQLIRHV